MASACMDVEDDAVDVEEKVEIVKPWDNPDTIFVYYIRNAQNIGFERGVYGVLVYHEILSPYTNVFLLCGDDHKEWHAQIIGDKYRCIGNNYYCNSTHADRVYIGRDNGKLCEKSYNGHYNALYDHKILSHEVAARVLTVFAFNHYLNGTYTYSEYHSKITKIWWRLVYPCMKDNELEALLHRYTEILLVCSYNKLHDFSFALMHIPRQWFTCEL